MSEIAKKSDISIRVISICSSDHLSVWKLTSQQIIKYLAADAYFVYVPENERELFQDVTSPRIEIRSQADLGGKYRDELYKAVSVANNSGRFGWYLQQFYKLELVFQDNSPFDITVIWDADCVPTREIPIVDENNRLVFMGAASEAHKEYFALIYRLLKISKEVNFSFVIPSFPIAKEMGLELREEIQSKNYPKKWHEVLIDAIDFRERSGLSETELLGTWIVNKYVNSWIQIPGKWERRGQKRFGYAKSMSLKKIEGLGKKHDLDIISFENWDTRGFRLILKRLGEMMNN